MIKFAICAWLILRLQPIIVHAQPAGAPVKLGAIVSLTGDAARNGLNWLEGAETAIDELNRSGTPAELIVEDDGTVPSRVSTAFIKLATVDKVQGVIGGTWDFLAETAYPLARQYRTPFITPMNPVEILSPAAKANPWVFTNGLSLAAERVEIDRFIKAHGVKSIGLVYINVPYGTSHAELVRASAKDLGVSIVFDSEITYQGFHDGIKLAALKVSEKKPDLVFAVLNYEGIDLLMRELEQRRVAPLVLMTHTLKEAYDFGGSPVRYQRAYGIFSRYVSTGFTEAFQKKFGRAPYDYAAAGYDAVLFMAEFVRRYDAQNPDALQLTYDGVTGVHRLPAPNRGVTDAAAVVLRVKDGTLEEQR